MRFCEFYTNHELTIVDAKLRIWTLILSYHMHQYLEKVVGRTGAGGQDSQSCGIDNSLPGIRTGRSPKKNGQDRTGIV